MELQLFQNRFLEAADAARDFARRFVEETLPNDCLFHLHLNRSHDRDALPEYKLFPEDSSPELAVHLKHVCAEDVISMLWRDGMVPQWVNLNVVGESDTATLIEVIACGRFTTDEARLYHLDEGRAPFHVLGPSLPVNYVEGTRFSIYARSTCWTEADLRRSEQHASRVWSLELNGPAFTDEVLSRGLNFPSLEILQVDSTRTRGPGLQALAGASRLRFVRITCGEVGHFDVSLLPIAPQVEAVSLGNLPQELVGVGRISTAFPGIVELSLSSTRNVCADMELIVPNLEHLSLDFPEPQQWVRGAPHARRFTLHYENASDEEVSMMLQGATDTLAEVVLRGTPVTDQIFATLSFLPNLAYVNLAETKVTAEATAEFVRVRPKVKYYPRHAYASHRGEV